MSGTKGKLVVFSACQTGSGKLERAEGVTGMNRAVMYAGENFAWHQRLAPKTPAPKIRIEYRYFFKKE